MTFSHYPMTTCHTVVPASTTVLPPSHKKSKRLARHRKELYRPRNQRTTLATSRKTSSTIESRAQSRGGVLRPLTVGTPEANCGRPKLVTTLGPYSAPDPRSTMAVRGHRATSTSSHLTLTLPGKPEPVTMRTPAPTLPPRWGQ